MKKIIFVLGLILIISSTGFGQTVINTYSAGDIGTDFDNVLPYTVDNTCNGSSSVLSIVLPAGGPWDVTSIDIVYDMIAFNGAYMSEQKSLIYCQNTTTSENAGTWYSGVGGSAGTYSYNRTTVNIANGIYAGSTVLNFEMWADRTWGGSGCGTAYNFVDDGTWTIAVHYQVPPTCPDPSSITVSNITGTTADLSWTENGSATTWDIELGLAGFSATGTPTQSGVTNSYTYTGLSAVTSYDYYVRADCGGSDYSTWVGPYNFTTPCATYTIPYFEGFEFGYTNAVAIGGCLTQESTIGAATWMANSSQTSYNRTPRTGSFNATLYYGNDDWIFIPIYLTTGQNYEVSLYARQDGSTSVNADISIKYGSSGTATAMTNSIVTDFGIINGGYQEVSDYFTVPSDGTYYIGILGSINSSPWYISLDDISVIVGPSCLDPSDLAASSITASTADLSWTENGTSLSWDIEIGIGGFSPTGTPTHVSVWNNYTMNSLSPETSYDYYLRSDCGGSDYSNWVGPYNFTTTISCPAPSVQTATSISVTTADLGWTIGSVESAWDIELGLGGFVTTGIPTQTEVTSNPYTYTGLVAGTDYDYYVRAYCGVGDESTWEGPYSFTTTILVGDVNITASLGTTSGTYNTLKETFDKINDGTHKGVIEIQIGSNDGETITETSAAVLNQSGSGSASYSLVTITPGANDIKLVGSIAGACCVPTGIIKLNGSQNIIVDGRQNSTGSDIDLTIENISTQTWGCALAFVAASNNTIKYCTFKSGNTASSGIGTVTFADNNTGGGSGSSFNVLEECHITKSGSNIPRHAVAGDGASTRENYNNIIRNCKIYDFEEFGIFLGSSSSSEGYNRAWIIDGNDIYQTVDFTNQFIPQIGICIGYPYSSSSSGKEEDGTFTISNNNIGGDGSGAYWDWSGSLYLTAGIYVYSTTDTDSSYTKIDGNEIHHINIASLNGNMGSTDKCIFGGIVCNNCRTWIGSTSGNLIGSLTDEDNITFTSSNGSGVIHGISMKTSADYSNRIINNTISGISITSGTGGMSFHGIHNNCATTNTTDSISQNNISYITTTKCSYFTGISGNGFICKNRIRDIDFTGSSTFAILRGINWYGGNVTGRGVENNEIILGLNKNGTSIAVEDEIVGIELGRNALMYYNSVLIEGTGTGSDDVKGVYIDWASGTEYKNNLVYIDRDGGSGDIYAIYNDVNSVAGWTSNNNAYIINSGAKANSYLGYWDATSTNISDLASWETASGESNSIFDTPANQPKNTIFPLLTTQDNLDVDDPSWLEAGVPSVEIIDIRNNPRDLVTPTIGAYEKADLLLPVKITSYKVYCNNEKPEINWTTASEINSDYFLLQISNDAISWQDVEMVFAAGNSNVLTQYSYTDANLSNSLVYYRLKMVDLDGTYEYSEIVVSNCQTTTNTIIEVYPNPAKNLVNVCFHNNNYKELIISITNIFGQDVFVEKYIVLDGNNTIQLDIQHLSSGMYIINIRDAFTGEFSSRKLIKENL